MKRWIVTVFLISSMMSLLLTGCGGSSDPTNPTPSGGIGMPVDEDIDDARLNSDGSDACKLGSIRMLDQHLRSDGSIAFEEVAENPIGVERVHVTLNDGVYTFKLRPLIGPECTDGGPASATITVEFSAQYHADVDRSIDPVCVFRSRLDFSEFNIRSSPQPVDNYILGKVKNNVWEQVDERLANQLNELFYSANRDPDADVRCEWSVMP